MAISRSTQAGIARDCERELNTSSRGNLGSLAMFYCVCEKGEHWQAFTNGLAEVGFGLLHKCLNAGPSRRNRRSIENILFRLISKTSPLRGWLRQNIPKGPPRKK